VGEEDIDIPTLQKVFNVGSLEEYKQIVGAGGSVELNTSHKYGHLINQFVEWLRGTKD